MNTQKLNLKLMSFLNFERQLSPASPFSPATSDEMGLKYVLLNDQTKKEQHCCLEAYCHVMEVKTKASAIKNFY